MIINFDEVKAISFYDIEVGEVFSVFGTSTTFYMKCRNPENNKVYAVNLSSGVLFTDCSKWKCRAERAVLNISK